MTIALTKKGAEFVARHGARPLPLRLIAIEKAPDGTDIRVDLGVTTVQVSKAAVKAAKKKAGKKARKRHRRIRTRRHPKFTG